ncbi:MAG TPA: GNAT family N-acetyltransferase [Thermoanaerobaculia bacterium]|nr:GNAT family N-acetyltransferase [Thermoanaerobaculia bacterium]
MAIREASRSDLGPIRQIATDANETPYELAAVIEEKCFEEGAFGSPVTLLAEVDGEPAGLVTTDDRGIRILAVRRSSRRMGIGTELLTRVEERARAAGRSSVEVYSGAGNYFLPGVPADDSGTLAFFDRRGYLRGDVAVNLAARLDSMPYAHDGARIERATAATVDEIVAFIRNRFGALWSFEAARAMKNDPPTLFAARAPTGEIAGFSAHEANNRGLGFFGPAGVEPAARKIGLGRELLLASLGDLRRLGYREAVISWAASEAFYARVCDATPSLRMVRFSKPL